MCMLRNLTGSSVGLLDCRRADMCAVGLAGIICNL